MQSLINRRWFPVFDLLFVLLSGALWFVAPGRLSWQPLLIALFPWFVRVMAGCFPFSRTPFDFLLLGFLLTAVMGVWVAYDQEVAWSKFWIIVSAILLYYALAGQPLENVWFICGLLGMVGVIVAIYFLQTHDWQAWPADFDRVTRIGIIWMGIRPSFNASSLHPNIAGGLIATFFPLLAAFMLHAWRQRRVILVGITAVAAAIASAGLLLSSSRAAWLALLIPLGIWLLWQVISRLQTALGLSRKAIFIPVLTVSGILSLWLLFFLYNNSLALPANGRMASRLSLANHTADLIRDFPFTGGGLASFAGLYSHYIRFIPFFFFSYGHNFLLDVAFEQGILGSALLVVIMSGSVWLLVRTFRSPQVMPSGASAPSSLPLRQQAQDKIEGTEGLRLFRWAVLVGFVTMVLHGLVDDAFYGNLGTPLLFCLPGLGVAISRPHQSGNRTRVGKATLWRGVAILAFTGIVAIGLNRALRQGLVSSWYANLGAVEMARVELVGWPNEKWGTVGDAAELAPATALFNRALQHNPRNRSALHHLGLIAMLQQDYNLAIVHLEKANRVDKTHRGIGKALGYSYVWTGEMEKAAEMLAPYPEVERELDLYVSWWQGLGYKELSQHAAQMRAYLLN